MQTFHLSPSTSIFPVAVAARLELTTAASVRLVDGCRRADVYHADRLRATAAELRRPRMEDRMRHIERREDAVLAAPYSAAESADYAVMLKMSRRSQRRINRLCRQHSGDRGSRPVVLSDGDQAPAMAGRSYHWTNKSGTIIDYPNAYSRAFGRPIYHPSTTRTEVGRDWVRARLAERIRGTSAW